MEKLRFDYSMKNIPIPPRINYKTSLLEKIESVIKRMRWKALFFLNPKADQQQTNKCNLKSRKCPPPIDELKPFEEDMFQLVENVTFKQVRNAFQDKLRRDVKSINSSKKVLVFADKTRNLYEMDKGQYEKMLRENITKTYRKADDKTEENINHELKHITNKLEVPDRVEKMAQRQAFISLKDHKENFQNNPKCRLINPAKNNLGLVSKQILDRINNNIRSKTKLNQWKNTKSVVDWFSSIGEKHKHSFLVFDIVDFYPSISEDLLRLSLEYAKQHTAVSEQEVEIIMHSRKTLLFDKNEPWVKRGDSPMFDVAMGCYDGAEVCELVGLYILHKLSSKFPEGDIGLYRDDGLAIFKNMNARAGDKARKEFSKVIGDLGLKITVQSNLKVVDYLDVTLNLTTGKYYPFRKPNNDPLYINAKSNHPPSTIRQIPASISTRISGLSCNRDEFDKSSQLYNDALKSSGYNEGIHYVEGQGRKQSKNRSRNIIWFNPPNSQNVRTNIAKSFLCLIDKHFPKSHKLHKIFNRNNLKVSYSCTTNMANIIKSHNQKILNENNEASDKKKCNCRSKNLCPLDGACLTKNIIYEATVTTSSGNTRTYIGMTEHEFKTRYNNHKLSFKDRKHSHDTVLSKHIWDLKDGNTDYEINWRIIKRANAYKGKPSRCNLCLAEKLCILTAQNTSLLNKKSELVTKCRHENKFFVATNKKKRPSNRS